MKFIYRVRQQRRRLDDPPPGIYVATDIVVLACICAVLAISIGVYVWRAW